MSEKSEQAVERFKRGFNCSQAVLGSYCREFGLDCEQAFRIATGFGGGMRMAETCGAVTGAFMVLGLKAIGAWTESQEQRAASDAAQAQTWQIIADVMDDMEGNTNANILLADKLKELYGTNNLQGTIRRATNETL